MGKLTTPDWIKEGFDSPEEYAKSRQKAKLLANSPKLGQVKGKKVKKKIEKVQSNSSKSRIKEKTFKVKKCPKCESYNVNVVLIGEEGKSAKDWECKKCKWHGKNIEEEELREDEFMKYLDEKGEEVA